MKCGFSQTLESHKKNRGFELVFTLILLVFVATSFVSCTVYDDREVEAESILVQPAYHLAIYRSEFAFLFYETNEQIGFQIADGIFLYNYKEDHMEAAFALSEGCFEPEYAIYVPTISADEKSIII
ncbi:MAG: hypothetical protein NUK65_13640, partial [Firmicutes bacterium]|nr:hypothetical protein [Bacillota bacterium]